jgi:hypothetical protein
MSEDTERERKREILLEIAELASEASDFIDNENLSPIIERELVQKVEQFKIVYDVPAPAYPLPRDGGEEN